MRGYVINPSGRGTVRDVFGNPGHPYTRELLASTISLSTRELHSIGGAPLDLVEPPSGCHFHPRCPEALEVCALRHPPTLPAAGPAHNAECWLLDDLRDVGPAAREPMRKEVAAVADEA